MSKRKPPAAEQAPNQPPAAKPLSKAEKRRIARAEMSEARRKQLQRQKIVAALVVFVTAISLAISVLTPFFMR